MRYKHQRKLMLREVRPAGAPPSPPPTGGEGPRRRRPDKPRGWVELGLLAAVGALYFVGAELGPLEPADAWVDERQFWEPIAAVGVLLLSILLLNERRGRRRVEAALQSIARDALQSIPRDDEVASELVPICISCKALADEGERWEPLEAYLARRTPDKFTHTLCPHCLERRVRG